MLVLDSAPIPLGHAAGAGRIPIFNAPEHASFDGAAPPLHVVAHPGVAQTTQETKASHPAERTIASEVNTMVKHPELPVTNPGLTFPVNTPTKGDAVVGPLYMVISSKIFSKSKNVKFKRTQFPGTDEQIVIVKFSLLK